MDISKDITVCEAFAASAPALCVSPLISPHYSAPAFHIVAGSPSMGSVYAVDAASLPQGVGFFVPCPSYSKLIFTVRGAVESRYIYDGAKACGIVISVGSDRREAVQCSKEIKKVCKSLSPKVNFCARSYRVLRL